MESQSETVLLASSGVMVRFARLAHRRTRFESRRGQPWIFACENRAGRSHWFAGFLWYLPFPPPLYYGTASYLPHFTISNSSALKTFIGSQDLDVKSRPNLSYSCFSISCFSMTDICIAMEKVQKSPSSHLPHCAIHSKITKQRPPIPNHIVWLRNTLSFSLPSSSPLFSKEQRSDLLESLQASPQDSRDQGLYLYNAVLWKFFRRSRSVDSSLRSSFCPSLEGSSRAVFLGFAPGPQLSAVLRLNASVGRQHPRVGWLVVSERQREIERVDAAWRRNARARKLKIPEKNIPARVTHATIREWPHQESSSGSLWWEASSLAATPTTPAFINLLRCSPLDVLLGDPGIEAGRETPPLVTSFQHLIEP
ncbi:hypothetical protein PR048_008474 [Dryococelus australis]|uniref:Uncharacterized protein n=1 Tax=Dryococelus australis TaxID=614101 RepID=A0ABQ9HXA3_9NEOP|nr:hypothetical protein PR048_008474 [Dryococelus australis]